MLAIRDEMETNPGISKGALRTTRVSPLDEVKAVNEPRLVRK
jgi:hypothetical protein